MSVKREDIKPGVVLVGKNGKRRKVEAVYRHPRHEVSYRHDIAAGWFDECGFCHINVICRWAERIEHEGK